MKSDDHPAHLNAHRTGYRMKAGGFELLLGEEPPAMGSLPRYGFLELDANIHQAGDALR